jgi:hypothetical protein
MNFACSIDVSVAPMDLLNDGSMKIGSVGGGDSTGIFPRAGTGMGRKCSPRALAGTGVGKFPPRGGGDGKSFPDGEFPVAIPSNNCS